MCLQAEALAAWEASRAAAEAEAALQVRLSRAIIPPPPHPANRGPSMQAQRAGSAQTRGPGGVEEHQATLALLNAEFGA